MRSSCLLVDSPSAHRGQGQAKVEDGSPGLACKWQEAGSLTGTAVSQLVGSWSRELGPRVGARDARMEGIMTARPWECSSL